jgi:hypothetical protein
LNISVWPASKLDRDTTAQVNTDASAVVDAARVHKNLFAGTNLRKEIENFAAKVRLYHNQRTLPWADKGERMLPTALFMEYKQTMNAYEQTFNAMCGSFFHAYPELVKDAPTHLGKMYRAEDYPELEDVKLKFGFRRTVKPVPEAGDFRLDIPANDLAEMQAEFTAQQDNKLADAMREPWERLHEMLVGMSKKLDDTSGGKKRYHDTLVSNPLELCSLLTKMNITNDPKLEEARKELELTMLGTNIEAIKEDEHHRTEVKAKVDAIIKKFEW